MDSIKKTGKGKKIKILIIEDERLIINALIKKLSVVGYKVIFALEGDEGIRKAKKEKPDLILLDIIMPKMDGITVLKKLKSKKETKNIPVVVLSNLSDDRAVEEAMLTGSTDYLIKSNYSLDDVVKKIGALIQR